MLMAALVRAVDHAHAHAILHRDLKPGNVLFDSASRPFVSDFGPAETLERETGTPPKSFRNLHLPVVFALVVQQGTRVRADRGNDALSRLARTKSLKLSQPNTERTR